MLSAACGSPQEPSITPSVVVETQTPVSTQTSVATITAAVTTTATATATNIIPNESPTVLATATPAKQIAVLLPTGTTAPTLSPSPTASAIPSATRVLPTQNPQAVARGAKLFVDMKCAGCHIKPPRGQRIAPDLSHIATDAELIIRSPEYHGKATDAASFIYESITDPNAFVQPPFDQVTVDGLSLMPKDFAQRLAPADLQALIAYLLTMR